MLGCFKFTLVYIEAKIKMHVKSIVDNLRALKIPLWEVLSRSAGIARHLVSHALSLQYAKDV